MNILAPGPTTGSASGRFYKLCATVLDTTSQRHQSTYRRARSKLNIKPNPDFLPSRSEPHDHIIHNPPPSMPNVYHTPTLFLPKEDQRRSLQTPPPTKSLLAHTPAVTASGHARLPPAVRKPYTKRYHLTEADFDEMRRLRAEDPFTWSCKKLAKKFDCSTVLVSLSTHAPKEKRMMQQAVTEVIKSRWGTKRRLAREDRALRREKWYSDS